MKKFILFGSIMLLTSTGFAAVRDTNHFINAVCAKVTYDAQGHSVSSASGTKCTVFASAGMPAGFTGTVFPTMQNPSTSGTLQFQNCDSGGLVLRELAGFEVRGGAGDLVAAGSTEAISAWKPAAAGLCCSGKPCTQRSRFNEDYLDLQESCNHKTRAKLH